MFLSKSKPRRIRINDPEYDRYLKSGESLAVSITKDLATSIDTKNKWIDVISISSYEKRNMTAFNYFIVEIFPRKIHPVFQKDSDEYMKRYITWKTAHEDIGKQRSEGTIGPKYLVLSILVFKCRERFVIEDRIWDTKWQHWVMDGILTPTCIHKPYKRSLPPDPNEKGEFNVLAVQKVTAKQVEFIDANEYEIVDRIIANRRPELSLFNLPGMSQQKNPHAVSSPNIRP